MVDADGPGLPASAPRDAGLHCRSFAATGTPGAGRLHRVTGEPLSIATVRIGAEHRVSVAGELDIATVDQLQHQLQSVEQSDAAMIVLDLSGLTFIDSTGLRLVLDLNDRCGGPADRLRIVAGAPAVERLLDIVGLRDRLPLISS